MLSHLCCRGVGIISHTMLIEYVANRVGHSCSSAGLAAHLLMMFICQITSKMLGPYIASTADQSG